MTTSTMPPTNLPGVSTSALRPIRYTDASWTVRATCLYCYALRQHGFTAYAMLAVDDRTLTLVHAEFAAGPDDLSDFLAHAILAAGNRVPSRLYLQQGRRRYLSAFAALEVADDREADELSRPMVAAELATRRLERGFLASLPWADGWPLELTIPQLNARLADWIADRPQFRSLAPGLRHLAPGGDR